MSILEWNLATMTCTMDVSRLMFLGLPVYRQHFRACELGGIFCNSGHCPGHPESDRKPKIKFHLIRTSIKHFTYLIPIFGDVNVQLFQRRYCIKSIVLLFGHIFHYNAHFVVGNFWKPWNFFIKMFHHVSILRNVLKIIRQKKDCNDNSMLCDRWRSVTLANNSLFDGESLPKRCSAVEQASMKVWAITLKHASTVGVLLMSNIKSGFFMKFTQNLLDREGDPKN